MKKTIVTFFAVLLVLLVPLTAAAEELTGCTVAADAVIATAGQTVTVPVRILENPGFTNFAIRLDYDREKLTLLRLETAENDTPYLCGTHVSTNPAWTDGTDSTTCGYIVCAHEEAVKEDGILFTAVFQVEQTLEEPAVLTPQVQYIRNQTAQIALFETIQAETQPGSVTTTLTGDVNFDGFVTTLDALFAYKIALGQITPTEQQKNAADVNKDEIVTTMDALKIYKIGLGNAK